MRNSILNSLICLLISCCFTTCKHTTEVELYGDINGTVIDALSKVPLGGASVTISSNSNNIPSDANKHTGSNGKYSYLKLDPGDYKIQVAIEGYIDYTTTLTVKAGENTSGDISLIPLQPVLDVSEMILDFGWDQTQLTLVISNTGKGDLTWNIIKSAAWLSVTPSTGETTVQKSSILVAVDRKNLSAGSFIDLCISNAQLLSFPRQL
jgi:hypothetical protein